MTLEKLRELYLAEQLRRGRAATTLVAQKYMLGKVLDFFGAETDVEGLTGDDWHAYRLTVAGAPTTRAEQVRQVKSWLRWAIAEGHLFRNPWMYVRELPVQAPVAWIPSIDQVLRLLQCPGEDAQGQRDRLMLEVLYGTGLRRSEANHLQVLDWQPELRGLWVREGKGKKDRFQPVGSQLAERLNHYLREVRPVLERDPDVTGLFLTNQGNKLSANFLANRVRHYARQWNLPGLTPHALRRAFASHLLERGAKIHEVQALLSHDKPGTTERYTQIERMDLIREYRRTHPRAVRKKPRPGATGVSG